MKRELKKVKRELKRELKRGLKKVKSVLYPTRMIKRCKEYYGGEQYISYKGHIYALMQEDELASYMNINEYYYYTRLHFSEVLLNLINKYKID